MLFFCSYFCNLVHGFPEMSTQAQPEADGNCRIMQSIDRVDQPKMNQKTFNKLEEKNSI